MGAYQVVTCEEMPACWRVCSRTKMSRSFQPVGMTYRLVQRFDAKSDGRTPHTANAVVQNGPDGICRVCGSDWIDLARATITKIALDWRTIAVPVTDAIVGSSRERRATSKTIAACYADTMDITADG